MNVVWREKEREDKQEGLLADRGNCGQDRHKETRGEVLQEESSGQSMLCSFWHYLNSVHISLIHSQLKYWRHSHFCLNISLNFYAKWFPEYLIWSLKNKKLNK